MSSKTVYIVNNSSHDFSGAKKFGNLYFLSSGPVNRYATNHMARIFTDILSNSKPDDYIVPCSLNVMNSIACAIFAAKHHKLNLLLFKSGRYIERNLIIEGK